MHSMCNLMLCSEQRKKNTSLTSRKVQATSRMAVCADKEHGATGVVQLCLASAVHTRAKIVAAGAEAHTYLKC